MKYMTDSVSSKDTNKFAIAAFFSGVGGIELGFEQTNKFRVVYANEFDKNANITYRLNFPETFLDNRDIHIVEPEDIKADNLDVKRAISWGYLLQKRAEDSIKMYRSLFESNNQKISDYLNMSYALWANNEVEEAVNMFKQYIESLKLEKEEARIKLQKDFANDRIFFKTYLYSDAECNIMLDLIFEESAN